MGYSRLGTRRGQRATLIVAGVLSASLAFAQAVQVNLPAQPLSQSLKDLAQQTSSNILFTPESVKGIRAPEVHGQLTVSDAIAKLLAATDLEAAADGDGGLIVRYKSTGPRKTPSPKTSVPEASSTEITEIIVTAQKRSERLQDVPVPVTAIRGEDLAAQNLLRLQDYYSSIPGLSFTTGGITGGGFSYAPNLSIRGVGGIGGNPTVGILVDDLPYGPTAGLAFGNDVPDFDPADLARVEVLRGPQGTLYGASSIGGLVKFVTIDPTTDYFSARVESGISAVYSGAEPGYNFRASANIPLNDTMALRASGFYRQDPGYIDDPAFVDAPQLHQNGINEAHVYGGRLSGLWRPTEAVSIKLGAMLQHSSLDGSPEIDVQPGLGDLQQSRLIDTGFYNRTSQVYSAVINAKLGAFDLTSVTGYNVNKFSSDADFTYGYGACCTSVIFGVPDTSVPLQAKTNKFTQELRLSTTIAERVDWLAGLYYDHEDSLFVEQVVAASPTTGQVVGVEATEPTPTTFQEYAVFTDFTIHFTDQFDIQLGGRESRNRQTYSEHDTGPLFTLFFGNPNLIIPEDVTRDSSFTYLVTPRLRLSQDLMLYARLASGYTPGGPNVDYSFYQVPASFRPATSENYELGAKGALFNQTLTFDASLYYIDWKDVQLTLVDPTTQGQYTANGSRAKSEGVELSLQWRPVTGLTLGGWVTLTDAELTQAFPAASVAAGGAYGASGDRLPFSSRFSGNLSVQDDFPITGQLAGFVGAAVSYIGRREGPFTTTPERQEFAGYAKTDLRSGLHYRSWTLNAFVTNLTDQRGAFSGGIGTVNPPAFFYIQPRTAGVSVAKTF